MGELAGKKQLFPNAPANAPRQKHLKIRLPKGSWRWMLPLAAAAIIVTFNGCADRQEKAKQEGGDSTLTFQTSGQVFKPETKEASQDSLQLTHAGRAQLQARLDAIGQEDTKRVRNFPTIERGHLPITKKMLDNAMKAARFNELEKALYQTALDGKSIVEIRQCKDALRKAGEQFKDPKRAEEIIVKFDRTASAK